MDLRDRLTPAIARIFRRDASQITDDLSFMADLNATSRDLFALSAVCEQACGFSVGASTFTQNPTVGEAISFLEAKLAEQA